MSLKLVLLALVAQQGLATIVQRGEHYKRQSATITVNTATTYQTMDGFGFSEAFGFVNGLFDLPAAQQTQGLDLLFSPTTGAALNIVRNRIGSTAYDSIEPNSPGSPSATPSYVALPSNDSNQLWFSQKAQTYGVTNFYADAWSAPGYMKTNGNESGGGYLCGVTNEACSSGDWRQAYANYLVQYIKDYAAAGVPISHVGFLNEPEFAASYSAMLSDGTQAASFIEVLYSTLRAAGLSTGIACCDAEGWDQQKTFTAQLIAAGAESKLSLITSHSYTSSPDGPIDTTLPVWQTEYADLNGSNVTAWYTSGGAGEGLTWANHIYQAVVLSEVSAYLHWIGIQSSLSDAALVFIDSNNNVIPTGKLWAFGQWSRYVQPGAVRVAAAGSTSTLLVSAFKNTDGSLSVQLLNNADAAESVTVALSGFAATSVVAYVTDNANNDITTLAATVSGGKAVASVPARSMVTLVLKAGGSSGSTTTSAKTTTSATKTATSSVTTTSTAPSATQTKYGQCGGLTWSGPTACAAGSTCTYSNAYYSQCL